METIKDLLKLERDKYDKMSVEAKFQFRPMPQKPKRLLKLEELYRKQLVQESQERRMKEYLEEILPAKFDVFNSCNLETRIRIFHTGLLEPFPLKEMRGKTILYYFQTVVIYVIIGNDGFFEDVQAITRLDALEYYEASGKKMKRIFLSERDLDF